MLAALYVELQDWVKVRQQVLSSNLLQTRTLSTSKKLCTELISRLKTLTPEELDLLVTGSREEQCYMLWLAVCKRYSFISDLAIEVLREKFLHLNLELTYADYDRFFNTKAEWHDELARLSTETHKKVRLTVFQLMREALLLTKQNTILPVLLSNRFLKTVCKQSKDYLPIFPLSDTDVRALAK
ncbi:MAG: hypothetical protein QG574_5242 [Cyanobacteriota bacterium erpe_2018_sw_21hr_WHONDRS-SW48-000092_B_bin.40]|nr:hypothetical protein [Cyanobacteriota bacterium erpe_2018_sw_21hr_WHONDRS-SW48-000092_B_bin.40]